MEKDDLQKIKNKYDIIGNSAVLNRAIEISLAVAPTDLSVLITGESGSGKDVIPRIIHDFSPRKTKKYIPINCGAIPEGTVESELFGHEKGAFTSASDSRRGYFEEADGGTIFLDEIGELPMQFQAKLLRVLQSGEFMRMGSSKVLKTDVRVIAATNVNILDAIAKGKFRADLYYRLNTIPIKVPSLRERPEDIHLLFRKFAVDFAERYGYVKISLTPDAIKTITLYRWPGNVRQLKNVAETVSAIESWKQSAGGSNRCEIDASIVSRYIPKDEENMLPVLSEKASGASGFTSDEKSQIIGALYSLNQEVNLLKAEISKLKGGQDTAVPRPQKSLPSHLDQLPVAENKPQEPDFHPRRWETGEEDAGWKKNDDVQIWEKPGQVKESDDIDEQIQDEKHLPQEDDLSLNTNKEELVRRALAKHNGSRALAARDLQISERTLYRLLNRYGIK